MTGILNRQALIENLSREINRSRRMSTPFSIIMCDLDFFKKINDTWGHLVGDYVLVRATQVLLENLRPYDCIARYGGEEFVIILPECGKDQARNVAERLRLGIENARVKFENTTITFTMSFGVTTILADNNSSIEEVLTIADRALYRAKDQGRNCVDCA
jgi:diguanylate cyclase (GGDEF)-like protein